MAIMHHYNHDDKLVISIPDSLSILQALQNGNAADTCRVLFLSGGFVGDAFEPTLSTMAAFGAAGECNIVMHAGDVVFANGEVFHGDGTPVTISIPGSGDTQYVIMSYQMLRHIKLDTASGYGIQSNVYGYRRDGVRLRVANMLSSNMGVNDLLVAEVRNPLDGSAPTLIDRRLAARHYRASSVLDNRTADSSTIASLYHGQVPSEASPTHSGNQYRSALHNDDRPGIQVTHSPVPSGVNYEYTILARPTPSSTYRTMTHWLPRAMYSFSPGVAGERMRCVNVLQDRNNGGIASDGMALDDLVLGKDAAITAPTPALVPIYDSATGHLLIGTKIDDMSDLGGEDSQQRSYLQIWMREGSVSHDIDPNTMPLQAEIDARASCASGYYPRRRYVPIGSSRSVLLSARIVIPGQVVGSMAYTKLTRSGATWLECNFGPDFDYRTTSYEWYVPDLGGDDWYTYNTYPAGGTSNYGRQTWWHESHLATLRAPGSGWIITSAEFVNHYATTLTADTVYVEVEATNGTIQVPFNYAIDTNNAFSGIWEATDQSSGIAIIEDEPLTITLTSSNASGIYYANGRLRLGLTKEQGA